MDVLLSNNLFQLVVPIKMQIPFYSHGMITVRQPVSGLVLPESQSFLDTKLVGRTFLWSCVIMERGTCLGSFATEHHHGKRNG